MAIHGSYVNRGPSRPGDLDLLLIAAPGQTNAISTAAWMRVGTEKIEMHLTTAELVDRVLLNQNLSPDALYVAHAAATCRPLVDRSGRLARLATHRSRISPIALANAYVVLARFCDTLKGPRRHARGRYLHVQVASRLSNLLELYFSLRGLMYPGVKVGCRWLAVNDRPMHALIETIARAPGSPAAFTAFERALEHASGRPLSDEEEGLSVLSWSMPYASALPAEVFQRVLTREPPADATRIRLADIKPLTDKDTSPRLGTTEFLPGPRPKPRPRRRRSS